MKNLIRIAHVVSKQGGQKIEIFDHHNLKHRDSKFNEFYRALQDQKCSDQEAAALPPPLSITAKYEKNC